MPADTAVAGRPVVLRLRARRFYCGNSECTRTASVEQVFGLTIRHGRRSTLLTETLRAIALALGGRAGSRLAHHLAATVSRTTSCA